MNPVDEILNTTDFKVFFGSDEEQAKKKFKKFLRLTHPDIAPTAQKNEAEKAFIKLNELWGFYCGKTTSPTIKSHIIVTKKHEYVFTPETRITGDIFERLNTTFDKGNKSGYLFTLRSEEDKDLYDRCVESVKKVRETAGKEYEMYFPELVEKFTFKDTNRNNHSGISFNKLDGFYSLTEVMKKYPQGLHPRHVAWIFRRILVALGNTADAGLVHGAPVGDNIIISPSQHGLILFGWEYSVNSGEKLVTVPSSYKHLYPKNILKGDKANHNLDVHLAAQTGLILLGNQNFPAFKNFFMGCLNTRVSHPGDLLNEFTQLMDNVFGERKFVVFDM